MNKKSRQIEVQCVTATAVSTLALVICCSVSTEVLANSADYRFLIDSDRQCQQISPTYQEVYAFETENFYINICQQDNVYFYLGEAKQSDKPNDMTPLRSSVFLTAYPLKDHRGFKAENGNVSYVVVLPFNKDNLALDSDLPAEAILTIKRNGQLVSVESSLNKYCHRSQIAIAPDIEQNLDNHYQLATIPLQQDIGWNSLKSESRNTLPVEIFDSNSRFDFYRIEGKLHRLTTCD